MNNTMALTKNSKLYSKERQKMKFSSTLRRNLTVSVSRTRMEISTLTVTLVVPALLSGAPVKFKLKQNTSEQKLLLTQNLV